MNFEEDEVIKQISIELLNVRYIEYKSPTFYFNVCIEKSGFAEIVEDRSICRVIIEEDVKVETPKLYNIIDTTTTKEFMYMI